MPPLSAAIERRVKRWQEQRWILDSIIKTVGIEWEQNRIGYTLGPCGPEVTADFMGVRARVQKFNDISREFKLEYTDELLASIRAPKELLLHQVSDMDSIQAVPAHLDPKP